RDIRNSRFVFAQIVNRYDVGMPKTSCRLRLAHESATQFWIFGHVPKHRLDGDVPFEDGIMSAVNIPHSPSSDSLQNRVLAYLLWVRHGSKKFNTARNVLALLKLQNQSFWNLIRIAVTLSSPPF